ncbi:hypothetical protein [Nocardioides sp.]|uniref:hypothetical protein n=1 Tax=Nocardioides sp. TaxID=35761 RepID=UPI002C1AF82E|nr:hypothetical protein [Nocardioides sp.]HXH79564.1 hypothetical protein [Nocardioides sp.]
MRVVQGQAFVGQTIRIDGRRFERCSFTDCVIEFGGAEIGSIAGCSLTRTGLAPVDAAETTLQQLALMYEDPGFREVIETMFDDVRGMFADEDAPSSSPVASFDA